MLGVGGGWVGGGGLVVRQSALTREGLLEEAEEGLLVVGQQTALRPGFLVPLHLVILP